MFAQATMLARGKGASCLTGGINTPKKALSLLNYRPSAARFRVVVTKPVAKTTGFLILAYVLDRAPPAVTVNGASARLRDATL